MNAELDATEPTHAALQARLHASETALRQATIALAARDTFITALGRELSNPLTPVMMGMDRLRAIAEGGNPERIAGALAMLQRAFDVFESRARSLLTFVEITRTPPTFQLASVNLSQAMQSAAARHAAMARRAGCTIELSIAPDIVVQADAVALDHVLDQMLGNALKFGAGHAVLLTAAALPDGRLAACVCDKGRGITPAEARTIFGLLIQPRPPGAPGLGIGLWISCRLAEAMGARITLAARPDWSTCFELAFPPSS